MTILLVVAHHVVMFLQEQALVPAPVAAANMALASLRMPLFFLASGLFLAGPLAAGWRTLLHKRVAFFVYLYLLWGGLQFAAMALLPAELVPQLLAPDPGAVAAALLVPIAGMWFLYALALFSVLAKLVRQIPASVQLGVTGVLSAVVGAGLVELDGGTWALMARYLFFFLLGHHARGLVERLAAATGPVRAGLSVLTAAALAALAVILGLREVPGVAFLLNVMAVTCGVLVAAELAKWRIGWPLVLLGRQTLPIYLANVPWAAALALVPWALQIEVPEPVQYLLPVLMIVLVTGLTLGTWRVLRALRAGWFYELPERLAYRPAARSTP